VDNPEAASKTNKAAVGAAAVTVTTVPAAVPLAMSTFGTVVPGVGTMHAAGGLAATLQASWLLPVAYAIGSGYLVYEGYKYIYALTLDGRRRVR